MGSRGDFMGSRDIKGKAPIGNGFWIERWKDKRGVKQPWTLVCHGFGYRQPLNAKSRPPRQKLCASSPSNCPPPPSAA